jgi:capsular polysaccharide biosynthesis protein
MKAAIEVLIRRMARLFGMRLIVALRPPVAARLLKAARAFLGVEPDRRPPSNVSISTCGWFRQSAAGSGARCCELTSAVTHQRRLPWTCDAALHWKFGARVSHTTPPIFLADLPNARVVGKAGFVVAPDETVLADVSLEWYIPPERHSLLFRPCLPTPQILAGTSVALAVASGDAYYHWFVDVLPRLAVLEKAGIHPSQVDHFILNGGNLPFQQESLDKLGIASNRRVPTSRPFHAKCERLLVPSRAGISGNPPSWVVEFLRERFRTAMSDGRQGLRLYISRGRAKYRHLTNEAEVRALLEGLGFQTVHLETLSFHEQVRLFSSAEAVVAPHGGGLTNIVFCPPGAKVIELFSPRYVNECFWVLADHARLDYFCHVGVGRAPRPFKDSQASEADITADLGVVRALLRQAGIQ